MNSAEQARLNQGLRLFHEGKLDESESTFRELVNSDDVAPQALAAIGLIQVRRGDLDDAAAMFTKALDRGASADAYYGLGVVAERRGMLGEALSQFQHAVAANPNHKDAGRRLSSLIQKVNRLTGPAPASPATQPSSPIRNARELQPERIGLPDAQAGLYNMLSRDAAHAASNSSELSRECMQFIESLETERRPRWSAYFGTALVVWGGLVVLFFVWMKSH